MLYILQGAADGERVKTEVIRNGKVSLAFGNEVVLASLLPVPLGRSI